MFVSDELPRRTAPLRVLRPAPGFYDLSPGFYGPCPGFCVFSPGFCDPIPGYCVPTEPNYLVILGYLAPEFRELGNQRNLPRRTAARSAEQGPLHWERSSHPPVSSVRILPTSSSGQYPSNDY